MGDLDHFKSINDQHGHLAGDQVLARAAAVFIAQARPYDLPARYGGEEFLVVLPGTPTSGAIAMAQRIRQEVSELIIPACPRQITISLGVAGWVMGETPQAFVARADAALYTAKTTGRNRVEAAPEPEV
jgi:diguanylate cyclase (GGDEF)-like protein